MLSQVRLGCPIFIFGCRQGASGTCSPISLAHGGALGCGCGCRCPSEELSRRCTSWYQESFLELALGAAAAASTPPFGPWRCHSPGTLWITQLVDFLVECGDALVLPAMGTRCSESRRMIIAWLCLHLPPVPERKGGDPGQSCGVPSDPGRDIPSGPCW